MKDLPLLVAGHLNQHLGTRPAKGSSLMVTDNQLGAVDFPPVSDLKDEYA